MSKQYESRQSGKNHRSIWFEGLRGISKIKHLILIGTPKRSCAFNNMVNNRKDIIMKTFKILSLSVLLIGLGLYMSCSKSSTGPSTGQLRLTLVDSPSEYDQVNIVVTKVDVHSSGSDSLSGWSTVRTDTATYDLLQLRNGADTILGDEMLPAGHYTQIRLYIGNGSNIVVGGVRHDLDISAANTVKLNNEFDIAAGNLYELILDFDADRSIVLTCGGQYKLKPVIRVEPIIVSGTISGTINPPLAASEVSTISGVDTITAHCDLTTGYFRLMALPAGIYNLHIDPSDTLYRDTTLTGITVTAQHNTDIGTVTLVH
jgi:hypothetical protein